MCHLTQNTPISADRHAISMLRISQHHIGLSANICTVMHQPERVEKLLFRGPYHKLLHQVDTHVKLVTC